MAQPRPNALLPLLSLVALAGASALAPAQSVTLRFKPKAGSTFTFRSTNKMSTSGAGQMSAMGNISQSMGMSIKVGATTAKGTTVHMKVTDVKFDVPKDSPVAANMASTAESLKGVQIEQLLSPQAKALTSNVVGGGPAAQQMMNQIGTLRAGFLGVEFPAGPVAPGAKWSTKVDFAKIFGSAIPGMVQMGKNSTVPIQYTLVKVENRAKRPIATIGFTMKGNMDMTIGAAPPPKTAGQPAPNRMSMKLQLDTKGSFEIDLATGMPLKGSSSGSTKSTVATLNIVQSMTSSFTVK